MKVKQNHNYTDYNHKLDIAHKMSELGLTSENKEIMNLIEYFNKGITIII